MRRLALVLGTLVLTGTPLGQYLPLAGSSAARAQVWESTEEQVPPAEPDYNEGAPGQPPEVALTAPPGEGDAPPPAFYDALAPYGRWLETQQFGWVWQPDPEIVGADFRPYASGGQWVYTSDGWAFESQWPFGWATFHYGRWYFDPEYGWLWVPGDEWAPSWVDWRYGDDYVGWVPLAPPGYVFSVGVDFYPGWCFVPVQFFSSPNVFVHVVPVTAVRKVYPVTRPVPNVVVVHGQHWKHGPQLTAVQQGGAHVTVLPSMRVQTSIEAHMPNVETAPPAGNVNRAPSQVNEPPPPMSRAPSTPAPSTPAPSAAPAVPHSVPPTMGRPAPHVAPAPAPVHVAPAPMHVSPPSSMGHRMSHVGSIHIRRVQ